MTKKEAAQLENLNQILAQIKNNQAAIIDLAGDLNFSARQLQKLVNLLIKFHTENKGPEYKEYILSVYAEHNLIKS